jgi:hypothetical protein
VSAERTKANKERRAFRIAKSHNPLNDAKNRRKAWLLDKRSQVQSAGGTWHDHHPAITAGDSK